MNGFSNPVAVGRATGGWLDGGMAAAADFLGNGAIEINKYEPEIVDIVRRNSVIRQRIDSRPATGHPHRYFEQTAIATAAFTDPRNIAPVPTGPTRVERGAMIKAITAQTNFSQFDVDVTRMQGEFAGVEAKDIEDITTAVIRASGPAMWTGTDTNLLTPTTIQYVGILTQITLQFTIAPGTSIVDALKSAIAFMISSVQFAPRPTAIYANPIARDYIDREVKAEKVILGETTVAGVECQSLQTQAGVLPLISEVDLVAATGAAYGFQAPPAGYKNYFLVIVTENWIERPVVHGGDGNLNPRLFQLGLLAGLQAQYVAVQFDAVIVKGASYAHAVVALQRQ